MDVETLLAECLGILQVENAIPTKQPISIFHVSIEASRHEIQAVTVYYRRTDSSFQDTSTKMVSLSLSLSFWPFFPISFGVAVEHQRLKQWLQR